MDKHYYLDPQLYIIHFDQNLHSVHFGVDFGGTGPKSSEPPNLSHSNFRQVGKQ